MLAYRPSALSLRASARFGDGASGLAIQGIGGGEVGVNEGQCWIRSARLFEPEDRPVGARLQQMNATDPVLPEADELVAAAEADELLDERNYLIDRSGEQFAPADVRVCPIKLRSNAIAVSK
jgi:hypothetical protein